MSSSDDDMFEMLGGGLGDALASQEQLEIALNGLQTSMILLPRAPCPELEQAKEHAAEASEMVRLLLEARYGEILASPLAAKLLAPEGDQLPDCFARVEELLDEEATQEAQIRVGCVAVASVLLFGRTNWVGPEVKSEDLPEWLPQWDKASLGVDSEMVSTCAKSTGLLSAALALLACSEQLEGAALMVRWWHSRALALQQECLEGHSGTLFEQQSAAREAVHAHLNEEADCETTTTLRVRFHLESALQLCSFHQEKDSLTHIQAAQTALGLELDVRGVLGRRLHSQTVALPQLKLDVSRTGPIMTAGGSVSEEALPTNVLLVESNLLEEPDISAAGEAAELELAIEEQALLLAVLELTIKTTPSDAGSADLSGSNLSSEEFKPYIERVLSNKGDKSWGVSLVALMHRSLLERTRPKTVERALLQLESLEVSFKEGDSKYVPDRVRDLFLVSVPAVWKLQRVLAEGYIQMGISRSALDIYCRIGDLPAQIQCLLELQEHAKAEALIKEKLAEKPSADLWCMLGEATGNPEHFLTGWDLSQKRHAKCMRLLGMRRFATQDMDGTIEALELSLAISRWNPRAWFTLGCAYTHTNDLENGARCYLNTCNQLPHDGECWNNLAGVYLRSNKKEEAFKAFEEAIKFQRRHPKVWTNYMYCALELREFQRAMFIMGKLVTLEIDEFDTEAFQFVTLVVCDTMENALRRAYNLLMTQISATKHVNHPVMWGCFAQYHQACGEPDEALEALLKQSRCLMALNWTDDAKMFTELSQVAAKLVAAYTDKGDEQSLSSAKIHLQGILKHKKALEVYTQHEDYLKLSALLDGLC